LTNKRDQVLVGLVKELDVQARLFVVTLLLGEVERRELDVRPEPQQERHLAQGY